MSDTRGYLHTRGLISTPGLATVRMLEDWLKRHHDLQNTDSIAFIPSVVGSEAAKLGDICSPLIKININPLDRDVYNDQRQKINWPAAIRISQIHYVYCYRMIGERHVAIIIADFYCQRLVVAEDKESAELPTAVVPIPGDFVDSTVWRGGTVTRMAVSAPIDPYAPSKRTSTGY